MEARVVSPCSLQTEHCSDEYQDPEPLLPAVLACGGDEAGPQLRQRKAPGKLLLFTQQKLEEGVAGLKPEGLPAQTHWRVLHVTLQTEQVFRQYTKHQAKQSCCFLPPNLGTSKL